MRYLLPRLLVLAATALPIAAHANPIDDFVLTDPIGDTIAFSLPASPPIFGPSNPLLFETFTVPLSFNPAFFGSTTLDGQILFYSALLDGGLNVMIYHPGGTTSILDHGDLLFSGTTADPTFLTGTFNVGSDTLTITPQTTPTPEPSTLALLATGHPWRFCLARTLSPQTTRRQLEIHAGPMSNLDSSPVRAHAVPTRTRRESHDAQSSLHPHTACLCLYSSPNRPRRHHRRLRPHRQWPHRHSSPSPPPV